MKKKSVKFTVNRMFLKRREVAAGALVALSVAVLCQWVLISRLTAQISFNKEWLLATVGPKKITLQDLSIDQSKALAAKDAE
ncbi:MAG: hypothetical protein WCG06_01525, partial [Candidatus Omnitrophota bacterium]